MPTERAKQDSAADGSGTCSSASTRFRAAAAVDGVIVGVALLAALSRVRAGLHTGECELVGDDIGGMAVNISARVGALAGADEVLVSRTVKDLVAGSGITFTDRGEHRLKGVPDEWRLFMVDALETPASNQLVPDERERRPADRMVARAARRSPRLVQRVLGWRSGA
jgi:class 3 adenylate cyclase